MTLKSPGVEIKEVDSSSFIESVTASIAGYVGKYNWGPASKITSISNIGALASTFGKPTTNTAISFFSAYDFLSYSNDLKLVRVLGDAALNATSKTYRELTMTLTDVTGTFAVGQTIEASVSGTTATVISWDAATKILTFYKESDQFEVDEIVEVGSTGSGKITVVSKSYFKLTYTAPTGTTPAVGDTIVGSSSSASATIIAIDTTAKTIIYSLTTAANFIVSDTITSGTFSATCSVAGAINNYYTAGQLIENEDIFDTATKNFKFAAKYAGDLGNGIIVSIASSTTFTNWAYKSLFDSAPGASEYHIVVVDTLGSFYGFDAGDVLETYSFVSLDSAALTDDNESAYYKKQINDKSEYIYVGDIVFNSTLDVGSNIELANGVDDNAAVADGDIIIGYQLFADPDAVDVFYLIMGDASTTVINSIISTVVEVRKDVVLVASPAKADVLNNSDAATDVVTWGNAITTSNRVFLDSNWKYTYDQYNDSYLWVPMNASTCGLNAATDNNQNPWVSPMGYSRGLYQNIVKLAWNPNQTERDTLYSASINPVFNKTGIGPVLLGDRTHTKKPSYFRQVGVRKMFIVVEKGIGSFAKYILGEFNNKSTRASFTAKANAYLRDLGAQGAFTAFEVICDSTNNTEQVVAEQKFRALIRILPQSSTNFVELVFNSVSSLSQFEEAIITQ